MQKRAKIFLFAGLAVLGAFFFAFSTEGQPVPGPNARRVEEPLRSKMRTLWGDHIGFTRNYIISALAGLKDQDAVAARLLENQDDIAAEFRPYYGLAYSDRLAVLLRAHINIAAEVVAAAKAGHKGALKMAQARWAANGAELVTHWNGANPHWDRQELAAMLKDHLELTTLEVESRLAGNWKADLENFDKLHAHMLMFSDFLVRGLEQQFRPDPKAPSMLLEKLEASDSK